MNWAIAAAIMLTFHGAAVAENPPQIVTVCMQRGTTTFLARLKASKIFADIGITIQWTDPSRDSCPAESIVITFLDADPPKMPESLAFALPFEGRHIVVFTNRIENLGARCRSTRAMCVSTLLAHVVAHEIGHTLMGSNAHSTEGMMKARWTEGDVHEMFRHGLAFLPGDAELILAGVDHWRARVAANALVDQMAARR